MGFTAERCLSVDRGDYLWQASAADWHADVCWCQCGGHCCALRRGCKVVGRDAWLCVDIQSARNKCHPSVHYRTRALRHIRPLLTVDTANDCHNHCCARLDYCNSLLYGTSEGNLDRLQHVQNQLAHVVLQAPWTASAMDMRRQLYWLPIRQQIVFKLATVTYKARLSGLPVYLQFEIHDYHPSRTLCSTQPQLFSFSNNQPLYHLQWEHFVQPLLLSGTLLVSTPDQLLRFWHLRTGLKLNCLNLTTYNCFWCHRSAPDSLANSHVGRFRNLFVCMYVFLLTVATCK